MSQDQREEARRFSRRAALKAIAGTAGTAAGLPILHSHAQPLGRAQGPSHGQAAKFFDAQQIQTIDALAETIIPVDEHSPGARAARVWVYIDTIMRIRMKAEEASGRRASRR